MAYTTIDKPSDYFTVFLRVGVYAGSGTTDFNIGFKPDLVWDKNRTGTSNHDLIDSVRGGGINLNTNDTSVDATGANVTSFLSNGFRITNVNDWGSDRNIVDWCWKAGTSFTNDASSTGIGSIDSTGSVSNASGFSIVSFTDGGSNATIAHGLGVVPKVIIIKNRGETEGWYSYWQPLGNDKQLRLNSTAASADAGSMWNDTTPTSSVFSLDTDTAGLSSGNYIAYCFAEKQGYSKFGSHVGNNSTTNGTFVYTGFKPAFVMVKITAGQTDGWIMQDNKRDTSNTGTSTRFRANTNAAEFTSTNEIDFLSNGFKCRGDDGEFNGSGFSYIYMAFAESPFVTSTGVPATAK